MSIRKAAVGCIVALLLMVAGAAAAQEGGAISIIFMHHSTGHNLIEQGGVREALTALGYAFWDHGYNGDGLVDPAGEWLGVNWDVPGDNTDPDGWYEVFNQPVTDPPSNTFSHMLQHDVIIFKSCFPASDIYDDERLETYRRYYLSIRDTIDQHPDKLFIAWTTPPLLPGATAPENATRARQWAEYLTSEEYLGGHPNLRVFDIFSLLADEDGYLRAEYRIDESDGHPNELANRTAGPIFVAFLDQAVREFVPAEALPVAATEAVEAAAEEAAAPAALIDDFEGADFDAVWQGAADEGAAAFACAPGEPGYEDSHAMQISFDLPPEVYAGCGRGVDPAGWAGAAGLRFVWRSAAPDQILDVQLWLQDTPFEAFVTAPDDDNWTAVTLPWADFVRAEWAEPGGPEAFDPALVTGLHFTTGHPEEAYQGVFWIDSLQLATGAAPGALVDDFTGADFADVWWGSADEGAAAFAFTVESPGYDDSAALHLAFDLGAGIYAGCGRAVDPAGWAEAAGLRFYLRSDTAGLALNVLVDVGGTPFEASVETPGDTWTAITLPWADFARAEWADVGSLEAFDPALVQSVNFATGDWEAVSEGNIWIDSIQLVMAAAD